MDDSLRHVGSHPETASDEGEGRLRRGLVKLLVVGVLALVFFLVPTLQGINLVADQSGGETSSTRGADDVASLEVLRLLEQP